MKSTILIAHEYGAPDVLEYTQQTLQPLALGNARIQVKAAGINPIDARRMTGEFKHAALPQTFGTEYAGIIVEVDETQHTWKVGDEVLGSGGAFTHASVIDVPLANLVKKPQNIDWAVAGSLAGAAQTAMTIFDEIGDIQSLLVHGGSGGVGSIVVQLAVEKGIDVVATASSANQAYIKKLGATAVVYGDGLIERLKQIHPTQFDASIDLSGTEEATQAALAMVKTNGFMGTIAGKKVSSTQIRPVWVKRNLANLQHVVTGVSEGRFHWEVSREYPFEQAQSAYSDILSGHTKGKSVLIFN
ncbi:zinc-binding dehydrogenase [Acinetobacter wanghuae]|uniref:Zinc-binding dehydrogenase n=1 Tax=Acinetobacter wanghuae TaxID=2662362 RepID=A0A5Q0P260_9GAMM|nr:NADP-dependent oxidoreductase [Acinetobacter wanghuae]MQW92269.1 zinc-binding dehydrogenase [Acinetobacter wanghuae]QGA10510.1 zinc-binding dehydrogenase [Acinetobacter wanghuae]